MSEYIPKYPSKEGDDSNKSSSELLAETLKPIYVPQDLMLAWESHLASYSRDTNVLLDQVKDSEIALNTQYQALLTRVQKYEQMLQDITMDSNEFTMDTDEVNFTGWNILAQASYWDYLLKKEITKLSDKIQGIGSRGELVSDITDEILEGLVADNTYISNVIGALSDTPLIRELDAALTSTTTSLSELQAEYVRLAEKQAADAAALADQLVENAEQILASTEAALAEQLDRLAEEAAIRTQLLQELEAKTDAMTAEYNAVVDTLHTTVIQELTTMQDGISASVSELKTADEAIITSLDAYKVSNGQNIAALQNSVNVVTNTQESIATQVTGLIASFDQIDLGLSKAQADIITSNQARADGDEALSQQITTLNTGLGDANSRIDTVSTAVSTLDSATATKFSEVEATLVGVDDSIASVRQIADTAATANTAQATEINALKSRMTVTEGDVINKADASALSSLDTRVGTVEGQYTSQASDITRLTNSLDTTNVNVGTAQTAAQNAMNAAGAKGKVIFGNTAPEVADQLSQNLWIDTTGNANTPKRWNGSAWVVVTDKVATDAANAVSALDTVVKTKADVSALNSLTTKVTDEANKTTANTNNITTLNSNIAQINNDIATKANASALSNIYTKSETTTEADRVANIVASGKIEQYKASLKVGGSNLLLSSAGERSVTNNSSGERFIPRYDIEGGALKPSTEYTLTIDIKASEGNARTVDLFFVHALNTQHKSKTNIVSTIAWVRHTYTFTTGNDADQGGYIRIVLNQSSTSPIPTDTLYTRLAQLEEGNVATAWTPNASEVQNAISANSSAIQTTNSEVSRINGVVVSQGTSLTNLQAGLTATNNAVATKADGSALTALTTRVSNSEGNLQTQSNQITSLTASLNNLKVGGTNLLAKSKMTNGYVDSGTGVDGTNTTHLRFKTAEPLNSKRTVVFSSGASGLEFKVYPFVGTSYQGGIILTPNVPYTFNADVTTFKVEIAGAAGNVENLTNYKIQLEYGTIPTDWSPAPEDIATTAALSSLDSKVTAVDGKVTTNSNSITTLSGKVTAVENGLATKADGSALSSLATRVSNAEGEVSTQSNSITSLKNSFSNLSVGGTNLKRNSDFATGNCSGWFTNGGAASVLSGDSKFNTFAKISGTGSNGFFFYPIKGWEVNTTYTASFYIRNATKKLYVGIEDGNAWVAKSDYTVGSPEWERVVVTFNKISPWGAFVIYLNAGSGTHSYEITRAMLEKGSVVSEWSPAPEDIDQQLSANATAISALDSKVTKNGNDITSMSGQITELNSSVTNVSNAVGTKADNTALSALTNRVASTERGIEATNTSVTSLESKLDKVSVGGTNYLPNTKDVGNAGTYLGFRYKRSTRTAGSSWYVDPLSYSVKDLHAGTYILSFYARANRELAVNNFFYAPDNTQSAESSTGAKSNSINGNVSLSLTTEWERYWVRWVIPSDTAAKDLVVARLDTMSSTEQWVEVAAPKLEKGSLATEWSPAPSDVSFDTSPFASASALSTLDTKVTSIDGGVSSQASQITTLTSDNTANKNALQVQAKVIDGVKANYMVKMETNGVIGGFGLMQSTGELGQVSTTFGVNADAFFIDAPAGGKKPFIVTTTNQVVDGITYPAGTWINSAIIANATIGTAHINDASITNAKILDATIESAKIKTIKADKIEIGNPLVGSITSAMVTGTSLTNAANLFNGTVAANAAFATYGTGTQSPTSGAETNYIQVDVGSTVTMPEVRFFFRGSAQRKTYIKLKASVDGVNWDYIIGSVAQWETIDDMPPSPGSDYSTVTNQASFSWYGVKPYRYLRIYGNGSNASATNELVAIIGNASGSVTKIGSEGILTNSITADKIQVDSLSAISANLGAIQVGSANIADLAVTTAKIGDLQVDTLKIKDRAVTVPITLSKPAYTETMTGGGSYTYISGNWYTATLTGLTPNGDVLIFLKGLFSATSRVTSQYNAYKWRLSTRLILAANGTDIKNLYRLSNADNGATEAYEFSVTNAFGSSDFPIVELVKADSSGNVTLSVRSEHWSNYGSYAFDRSHSDVILHALELKK